MTWLEIARGLAVTDLKQIARDRFLTFILSYTILLAIVARFGVPRLALVLVDRYGIDIIPYYGLISSFIALALGGSMIGLVLGFLLLDARETRVLEALSVSPVTFDRFLSYRVATPMVLAGGLNPLCAWIGGIGLPGLLPLIVISGVGILFAGISTLALATFADNKVQALAVTKIISSAGVIPAAAYFIDEPWQLLFGLFPPYWVFKAWWLAVAGDSRWWLYAAVGVATNLAFLWWMKRRFERLVHKGEAGRAEPAVKGRSPCPDSTR